MSGKGAAYKVAMKNAKRNRKRTIFLVLLVAVPVAFGVVVAGIVRASNLTPEEQAQTYFGNADARLLVYPPSGGVYDWIMSNLREAAPEATVTELRQTGIRVENIGGTGYAGVWDVDMSSPATEGFLVHVSGDLPAEETEVAISPTLAASMEVEVGDTVEFEDLPFGDLTVVGLVSEPFFNQGTTILLSPGALEPLVGDPELLPEPSLLVSGPGAEEAALQINDLWYSEGQEQFWPEPAVDPLPPEISFLQDDPQTYLLLTERDVDQLVELVKNTEPGPGESIEEIVYNATHQMIYGGGEYRGLPEVWVETRTQWLNQRSFGENPVVISTAAAAIVLVEVAFITGAAFAAGTRRRLREIGLMGANGASEKHVRSTVVGEGLTIGAVGAGLGVLLGIAVMVLARPLLHRFVSRVITGVGVTLTDVLGPVLVALIAVVLAVLIPARTASKVPTTTALQGRMPALSPRKWIIPVGIGLAVGGGLLISVSLLSLSNYAGFLVGVGATAVVGGVAMLSSPILAGVAKLSDKVPATSRLVLRDSGRNRTRSAVAVAAIMVILLAPVTAMITSATTTEKNLVYGLPSPSDHVVLMGSYENANFDGPNPVTEDDVAALAAIVPEEDVAIFDTLDLLVTTDALLDAQESDSGNEFGGNDFVDGYGVAVANEDLVRLLGDEGVAQTIGESGIVVLGIAEQKTRVEINGIEYPAHEYPVAVVQWGMPRVLIAESMAAEFGDTENRSLALFTLERPMTDDEWSRMWSTNLNINSGYGGLDEATIYLLMGAATLVVVLIVVALVTAVSAAEVDHEVRTIVAVGAPGSIRRRFLGLLTGYQTLVAMALAVPLGLGLVWVFSSAADYISAGPFGVVNGSMVVVPWPWLLSFAVLLPIVIGLLTLASVRSAPVTPPRRAT
jgi:ABC-type lipoprotein release transport system permease subunit